MKYLVALAVLMLAGCVMLTEDGQRLVTESSEVLLAPFEFPPRVPLVLVTDDTGLPITTETGTRLIAQVSLLITTEAGDVLTDELSNALRIDTP